MEPHFIQDLVNEVARPNHWLEGACIKEDLSDVRLSGARLPRADFEGRRLVRVALDGALLEDATFRSATLEGTLLYGSNLRRAAFDRATLRPVAGSAVDLRNAELGGASFTGATIKSVQLLGARFSERTEVSHLLDTPTFEIANAAWEEAANVYAVLGKRAAEDRDVPSEEHCTYLAMTCWHRNVLKAGPLTDSWWNNWLQPTLSAGLTGLGWLLHRLVWGYGLRPCRPFATMLVVLLFFGLVLFPVTGVSFRDTQPDGWLSHMGHGLVLSLNTFVTLTYGLHTPSTISGEIAAGIEAFLANILLALYLVSLAGKYVRRF